MRRSSLAYLFPVFLPLAVAALSPSSLRSAAGLLLLGALGAAGWAAAAVWEARRLGEALERASRDLELASRDKYGRWVGGEEWGPLSELAPSFNWLLQEVQGTLRSLEARAGEESAKLDALIHAMPDGILLANLKGEVLTVNRPAAVMLGLAPEDLGGKGRAIFELVHQDKLRGVISRILEKRARHDIIELTIEGAGGSQNRVFVSSIQLVANPEDQDVGLLITLRDVTTERELERVKGEFFQAVAHDLRAPLLGIQGYVRMVEKALPAAASSDKLKAYFRSIYQSCDRIYQLIQDILDLSRMEAGTASLELAPVRVGQLLSRVRDLFLPLAEEKGLEFVLDVPSLAPAPLQLDERLIERTVHNLVQNAIKFTPKGGRVKLGLTVREKDYLVAVEDTGPGIPADQLEAVFEKFRQLEGPQARSGFGLGLTIAKGAVEAHGGRIWAESAPGRGSRFCFTMPRSRSIEASVPSGRDPRD